jgi:hypothetical protein
MLHDLQRLGSLTTIWSALSDTWDKVNNLDFYWAQKINLSKVLNLVRAKRSRRRRPAPVTVHIDIQPSELLEITTARSLNQEKAVSVLFILSRSLHRPILTSCFSTFFRHFQSGASGVLGTPERLRARLRARLGARL